MDRLKLSPELNYWTDCILHNSPLNEYFFKLPIHIDRSQWNSPHSLIDLLFNETFESRESEPSSSSSLYDDFDGFRFSWGFRKADLRKIKDKTLLSRLTIYAGKVDVYVCNIPENEYMFATYQESDLGSPNPSYNPTADELYKAYSESNKGMVSSVCTPYRYSLTDMQRRLLGQYFPPENIFSITDEEVGMLEKLYEYKSNLYVTLDDVNFELLNDCLSKLIYIYLDWELNESMRYYDNTKSISNNSRLICSLYEKHVLDHLYRIISKRYNVTITRNKIDDFISLNHDFLRINVSEYYLNEKSIELPGDEIPYDIKDIYLVHNGLQRTDFNLNISRPFEENQEIVLPYITWNHNDFQLNDEIYILWSFIDPNIVVNFLDS